MPPTEVVAPTPPNSVPSASPDHAESQPVVAAQQTRQRRTARPGRTLWLIQPGQPLVLELATAAVLLTALGWAGVRGWGVYTTHVLPVARSVPAPTPTAYVDLAVAREEGRRLRQIIDYLGAGLQLRASNDPNMRREAIENFMRALALDPGNVDARQNLREMGVEPPPGPAVTPTTAPPTPLPTVTPRIQR